MTNRVSNANAIGLALSGGGIRAAVFHLGVLRQLASQGLLERIAYVSTVSGGSLLTGLVFHHAGNWHWPSSSEFLQSVHSKVKYTLCRSNLQTKLKWDLIKPWNWREYAFARANLLAMRLAKTWGLNTQLGELTGEPGWEISATDIEHGTRFVFRIAGTHARPCEFGLPGQYRDAKSVWLADALAASAAFPGAFGPLELPRLPSRAAFASKGGWTERIDRAAADTVQLMDGGLYDNLGLEPLVDLEMGTLKTGPQCDFVLASDGGAPVLRQRASAVAKIVGIDMRIVGILAEQTRTLRVRAFRGMLKLRPTAGALVTIGAPTKGDKRPMRRGEWPLDHPARVATLLSPLSDTEFVRVGAHGYRRAAESLKLPDGLSP